MSTPLPKILLTVAIVFSFSQAVFNSLSMFKIFSLKYADSISRIAYGFKKPVQEIGEIVIVKIDDESIRQINKKFPWPRHVIAEVLGKMELQKPKLIVLDLFLFGESEHGGDDAHLMQELEKNNHVLLGSYFDERGRYAIPAGEFSEKALGYGFVNRPRDMDQNVRRAKLAKINANNTVQEYSLSLKAASVFLNGSLSAMEYAPGKITVTPNAGSAITIPVDEKGNTPLAFMAGPGRLEAISFWRVLQADVPADYFKDKIVLIGATSELLKDVYPTCLGNMSGVEIMANDILMIITRNLICVVPYWLHILAALLVCLGSSCAAHRFSVRNSFISMVALAAFFLSVSFLLILGNIEADVFYYIFLAGVTFLTVFSYKYIHLVTESSRLKTLAVTDGLTGLYVYRYFAVVLETEFNRSLSEKRDLSVVIIDVDHFKSLNDTYGHEYGNAVLKKLAQVLQEFSRKQSDVVCRYGGEEFVVILKDTNQKDAVGFAEKIRKVVENYDFPGPAGGLKITMSLGVCGIQESKSKSAEELIKLADVFLYQAKTEGRNRTCFYVKS